MHSKIQTAAALLREGLSRLRGRSSSIDDMEEPFARTYEKAKPFTMTSAERMFALYQAVRYVIAAEIPGDFVECGVWRGGSSMMAALAATEAGDPRQMWLYDTYEGMTPPSDRDRNSLGKMATEVLDVSAREPGARNTWAYATIEDVKANMTTTGYPASLLRYVKGPVEQTIPAQAPDRISLLRLDTDWYESTKHELEHLWPRLAPGGVLIIDDYGHWEGARQAVDEYFLDRPILLNRIDYTGRIAVKAEQAV